MKGLKLSKEYFEKYGLDFVKNINPSLENYIAFGLVGQGSECLGYDDELSKDHDFSVGFCMWLPRDIYKDYYKVLQKEYDKLPKEFLSVELKESAHYDKRLGVFSIEDFYKSYIGFERAPQNSKEWIHIPETFLSVATSGQVFKDNLGEFSKIRKELLDFYPEQVIKKKLAAYMSIMAQTGQYNMPRSYKRKDMGAYYLTKTRFIDSAIATLFLLKEKYMPFYKRKYRALKELSYPKELIKDIEVLMYSRSYEKDMEIVEKICSYIVDILIYKAWVSYKDDFIQVSADRLQKSINDPYLKELNILVGSGL